MANRGEQLDRIVKEYFSEIGKKGGSAGRGQSKRRGDSEFYKKLAKMRIEKCRILRERHGK